MKEIQYPITVVNNDGTPIDDFPKNPLKDKWDKMITRHGKLCSPVVGYQDNGAPWMNYTCVLCSESSCHYSNGFVVPDEDKEVYKKYLNEVDKYNKLHGNTLEELDKYLSDIVE